MSKSSSLSGRISPKNRLSLIAPVREYAKANEVDYNKMMAAVLWCAERLNREPGFGVNDGNGKPARLCTATLRKLVNPLSLAKYEAELERRMLARSTQILGMLKKALPYHLQTDDRMAAIMASLDAGLSIPALKERIDAEVAKLLEPEAA